MPGLAGADELERVMQLHDFHLEILSVESKCLHMISIVSPIFMKWAMREIINIYILHGFNFHDKWTE